MHGEKNGFVEGSKRLFVALWPPETWIRDMARLQGALRRRWAEVFPGSRPRWVSPDRLHLTLAFLGEVPVGRVGEVQAALAQAVSSLSSFVLHPSSLGVFPQGRPPRVLWLGVEGELEKLAALAAALRKALGDRKIDYDGKAFRPHITLARLAAPERSPVLRVAPLGAGRGATASEPGLELLEREAVVTGARERPWRVQEVYLMESRLRPDGPVYEVLDRARLGKE